MNLLLFFYLFRPIYLFFDKYELINLVWSNEVIYFWGSYKYIYIPNYTNILFFWGSIGYPITIPPSARGVRGEISTMRRETLQYKDMMDP